MLTVLFPRHTALSWNQMNGIDAQPRQTRRETNIGEQAAPPTSRAACWRRRQNAGEGGSLGAGTCTRSPRVTLIPPPLLSLFLLRLSKSKSKELILGE